MSYDLLVFHPAAAPRDRVAFEAWLHPALEAPPVNASSMSGNLPDFYAFLTQTFPDVNGKGVNAAVLLAPPRPGLWARLRGQRAPAALDPAWLADYAALPNALLIGFDWTMADEALSRVVNTARATEVGVYDMSGETGDILHDASQFDAFEGR